MKAEFWSLKVRKSLSSELIDKVEFECCGLFIAWNSIFNGFLILLSHAFSVQTLYSSRKFTDIAKMGSGVVTKAEQTSWQNDSMRWNSNAMDTAGIFQFWFLFTHVSFLDGYVTFKVACVIWLTQVPDPHVPYWNAKKSSQCRRRFPFPVERNGEIISHAISFLVKS